MLFIASNVPLASDWMLLSYSDNKLRLCKSLNESLRMHDISFAFKSKSCSDVRPRKTLAGRSLILLPYKTLKRKHVLPFKTLKLLSHEKLTKSLTTWDRWKHHEPHVKCCCSKDQYDEVAWSLKTISVAVRWWNSAPNVYKIKFNEIFESKETQISKGLQFRSVVR